MGVYTALYNPVTGYRFVRWETTGEITVSDVNANQIVVVTVGLGDALRAVYAYWSSCDINQDLVVNMRDVGIAAQAFDTVPGDDLGILLQTSLVQPSCQTAKST